MVDEACWFGRGALMFSDRTCRRYSTVRKSVETVMARRILSGKSQQAVPNCLMFQIRADLQRDETSHAAASSVWPAHACCILRGRKGKSGKISVTSSRRRVCVAQTWRELGLWCNRWHSADHSFTAPCLFVNGVTVAALRTRCRGCTVAYSMISIQPPADSPPDTPTQRKPQALDPDLSYAAYSPKADGMPCRALPCYPSLHAQLAPS